ncbi:hypothetical protein J4414_00575 [Candidatus Woesearchaeota archaeon]|nr:hypothetical protein [Candidatus Woesearchaeota archaeon]
MHNKYKIGMFEAVVFNKPYEGRFSGILNLFFDNLGIRLIQEGESPNLGLPRGAHIVERSGLLLPSDIGRWIRDFKNDKGSLNYHL